MKLLSLLLISAAVLTAAPPVVNLYPGPAPGSEDWNWQESYTVGPKDDIGRISNVTVPSLTVYLPDKSKANGTGIVICPGGGFRILAIDHEGHEMARWLNSLGVAAFVLKYRVMRTGDDGEKDKEVMAARRKQAIEFGAADALEAMRLVRSRAAEWGVAKDRIGITGYSAGGYMTTAVALTHDPAARPDFAAPIYATMPEDLTPPPGAPPLFLVHADDDRTVSSVRNSVRMYSAWKQAGFSAELHIYSKGGHGFGMRKHDLPVDQWPDRLRDWLDTLGLLKPAP